MNEMSYNKYNDAFFENFEKMYSKRNTEQKSRETRPVGKPKPKKTGKVNSKRISPIFAVVSVLIALVIIVVAFSSIFKIGFKKLNTTNKPKPAVSIAQEIACPYPKLSDDIKKIGNFIKSEHGVLLSVDDNLVIAGKNYDTRISPASLTKILTLLVAVENCKDLNDTFTMTREITDPLFEQKASVAGFLNGEEITIKDLLYGAILPSGADATAALAIYTAGSEENFAKLMTEKAKKIGISTANFTNCSGLYGDNHYCTVLDIAQILKVAMQNETCKEVLSAFKYTTQKTEQHPDGITLTSTLFSRMSGEECDGAKIVAGKTGYINESGNCIASFAEGENGKSYIFVSTNAVGKWNAVFDHINIYSKYVGNSKKVLK